MLEQFLEGSEVTLIVLKEEILVLRCLKQCYSKLTNFVKNNLFHEASPMIWLHQVTNIDCN